MFGVLIFALYKVVISENLIHSFTELNETLGDLNLYFTNIKYALIFKFRKHHYLIVMSLHSRYVGLDLSPGECSRKRGTH